MQTIKIKYNVNQSGASIIKEYRKQYSSMLHSAYNRAIENQTEKQITSYLDSLENFSFLDSYFTRCVVKIRPLEYVGGGNCMVKIWSITHNGIEEPAYARRTIKISDFDIWDQFYKYSVNPSKVDLYKECVIDLIETGVCSINYNYVQDLFSKIQSIRRCQRFGMTNHSNGKDMPNDELKALLDEYRLAGCGEKVEPTIKICV